MGSRAGGALWAVFGLLAAPFIAAEAPERLAAEIRLEIGSGKVKDWKLPVVAEGALPPVLQVEIEPPQAGVPVEERAILVGLFSPEEPEPQPRRWPGQGFDHTRLVQAGSGNGAILLRVMARRCAPPGTHRVPLHLRSAAGDGLTMRWTLLIEVHEEAPCGSIHLGANAALLTFVAFSLVLFCGWSMWSRSEFLPLKRLSQKLRPQSWVDGREHRENKVQVQAVKAMLREGPNRRDRARVWRQSWFRRLWQSPRAAFPGGPVYREAFRIDLTRWSQNVSLSAVPEYLGPQSFSAPPARGILFAVAGEGGSVRFLAVPNDHGQVGALQLNSSSPTTGSSGRIVELRGHSLLDYEAATEEPDGPAGWKVG